MPLLETPDGQIETLEWGNGDELVVLLHASATGPQTLSELAQELSKRNCKVVAPARSGYGRTCLTIPTQPIAANLQLTHHVLAAHGGTPRILFGHSMGGLIALLAAIEQQAQGTPLDALVLYEPILPSLLDRDSADGAAALAWDRDVIAALNKNIQAGNTEVGVRGFVEAWNEVDWAIIPQAARAQILANAENLAREAAATSQYELDLEALTAMNIPTLFLQGETSPQLTQLTSRKAANLVPTARLVTIPSVGHMGPISSPKTVALEIRKFLDSLQLDDHL